MKVRTLPRWRDDMSDGCSVPSGLGVAFPGDDPDVRACCVRHDEAYYYGGWPVDRLRADLQWAAALLDTGKLTTWQIEEFFTIIRLTGGPEFRKRGVSWAFGGNCFEYSRKAEPHD